VTVAYEQINLNLDWQVMALNCLMQTDTHCPEATLNFG